MAAAPVKISATPIWTPSQLNADDFTQLRQGRDALENRVSQELLTSFDTAKQKLIDNRLFTSLQSKSELIKTIDHLENYTALLSKVARALPELLRDIKARCNENNSINSIDQVSVSSEDKPDNGDQHLATLNKLQQELDELSKKVINKGLMESPILVWSVKIICFLAFIVTGIFSSWTLAAAVSCTLGTVMLLAMIAVMKLGSCHQNNAWYGLQILDDELNNLSEAFSNLLKEEDKDHVVEHADQLQRNIQKLLPADPTNDTLKIDNYA